ncbi:MAG TPA: PQQ-binding-like beta-propeller repeat protein [Acidobacteriota bacterium]|nr:PQQ-binding-like beta-propeller repeat protein [Acidobacteriota bacterium]
MAIVCAGLVLLAVAGLWAEDGTDATERWSQFRGPDGLGVALEESQSLPNEWNKTENVLWNVEIPGRGWSSPIVWGERVFLTTATTQGQFKEPSTGIYGNDYIAELRAQGLPMEEVLRRVRERDNELPEESKEVQWLLVCLDASEGKTLWTRTVHEGLPAGGRHRKNTYASETPVTDGERVYVYFGNQGLWAYSLQGEKLWDIRWEPQEIYLDFGTSSSPVLHEGRLYILHDTQEGGFLAAVDAESGKIVWQKDRKIEHPMIRSSWSTPFVWENSKRTEIVTLGAQLIISYDLEGNELWRLKGSSVVAAPTPIANGDLLFVGSGSPSENIRPLFAIRAGASGDITLQGKETSSEFVAWADPRGGSYITSPIAYRGRVFVLYDKGFFAAYDQKSGEQIYKARIGRGGNAFSASPWAYDGKVFCLSEDGKTFVIDAAADEFEILAENDLEEMSLATPAIAHGSLYLRTNKHLYRLRAQ